MDTDDTEVLIDGELLVCRARREDRAALARMLELYQYDISDIWSQDLDAHGEYWYPIDKFWINPDCRAFIVKVDGHYAGFALVDTEVSLTENQWWMAQFFILKKYRRRGIGRRVAVHVFNCVPGRWEIGQMPGNHLARDFWRDVIGRYTRGGFVEHSLDDERWQGTLQCFDNSRPL